MLKVVFSVKSILRFSVAIPIIFLWASEALSKYSKELARDIVNKAEEIRTVDQSKSRVRVDTLEGKKSNYYLIEVLQSIGRRAYLEFLEPDMERNRRMLAIKTKYWSRFPDSPRVIPISRREAIGNSAFAIADVFQMDTKEDYDATVIGEEVLDNIPCYKVQLNAKHRDAPYFKVIYFVKKADNYPVKAEFYGASTQKLKTMTVVKSDVLAGRMRPKILKMVDNTIANKYSTWETITISQTSVPDNVFNVSYLQGR